MSQILREEKKWNSFDFNEILSNSRKGGIYKCLYCGKFNPKCFGKESKYDLYEDESWKVPNDRMKNAIKRFADMSNQPVVYLRNTILSLSKYEKIIDKLPGIDSEDLSAPKLSALNESQKDAIIHSIESPLSLIQGPPGTGKTMTAATLVYNLVTKYGEKVLVCAPSNTAVDNLTEKIWKTGLNVVRVFSRYKEEEYGLECNVLEIALHNIIQEKDPELKKLYQLNRMGALNVKSALYRRYRNLKHNRELEVLREAKVICCTCISAGDRRVIMWNYNSVLIDEVSQASVPECIVPIVRSSERIVLVGDHKQLGPVVMCQKAVNDGFERSLFEKLIIDLEITPKLLEIQYRMHPSLSQFPSLTFYDNKLKDDVTTSQRTMKCGFPWPQSGQPFCFICIKGVEKRSKLDKSYLNIREALFVNIIVSRYFINKGVKPHQIGIITPYKAQQEYLLKMIKDIDISSVNKFQGQEKEFIIFSCVRSHKGIGFLSDPRRLNVALTRARSGLIIVGNPTVLSKDKHWNQLLQYYREHKVLVEGPLFRLKPCVCPLSDPISKQD